MIKIMRDCWDRNHEKLRAELAERTDLNSCSYKSLVEITFRNIFDYERLNLDGLTEIDDGHYQGTILFVIPFATYQPSEYEYLMTYVGYGSCSYCDALQGAQNWTEGKLADTQISDFMSICQSMICNCIKPYNHGWRHDSNYDLVKE